MVKILSWNVASLRTLPSKLASSGVLQGSVKAEKALGAFFRKLDADIICLQETKFSDWSKCTKEFACIDGYDSFWSFSGKGHAGVATYARQGSTHWFTNNPFVDQLGAEKTNTPPHELSLGRCVLTDHGPFVLLNIYAINGGRSEDWVKAKLEFYDKLLESVKRWQAQGKAVIVTGDINTAHTEKDIYNPNKFQQSTGFLPIERDWITRYLSETKSIDAFRYFHPNERVYSFWDQRKSLRQGNYGWRIDAFYVTHKNDETNKLYGTVKSSDILTKIKGSDHCPIDLVLDITLPTNLPRLSTAGNARKEYGGNGSVRSFFGAASKKRKANDIDS